MNAYIGKGKKVHEFGWWYKASFIGHATCGSKGNISSTNLSVTCVPCLREIERREAVLRQAQDSARQGKGE